MGTFHMCRAAFEPLKAAGARGGALIINISMTLHYGATWWQAHASAAKVRAATGPRPALPCRPAGSRQRRGCALPAGACACHVSPRCTCRMQRWRRLSARAAHQPGLHLPCAGSLRRPLSVETGLRPHVSSISPPLEQAAVDSLTRSLGLEWGHFGIRTAGVAPGPIEGTAGEAAGACPLLCPGRLACRLCGKRTACLEWASGGAAGSNEVARRLAPRPARAGAPHLPARAAGMTKLAPGSDGEARMQKLMQAAIPLGHMGRRWDIAQACVFLASPAAAFVTGHTLVVDGGEWMCRWVGRRRRADREGGTRPACNAALLVSCSYVAKHTGMPV